MKQLAVLVLLVAAMPAQAAQPNLVLMFVDNLGYGDFGCYGNRVIKTPHIDKLAEEGVRCTDFYIGSPSCMPSRGALMTGRHAVRSGMTSGDPNFYVMGLGPGGLPEGEVTLAEALHDRGYSTAMVGKWCVARTRANHDALSTCHTAF